MSALRRLVALVACFLIPIVGTPESFAASPASSVPGYSMERLDGLYGHIQQTGVPINSIQAINSPRFISVADAALSLDDRDQVFVAHYPNGLVRVYPQNILVWHEVVNDVLPNIRTAGYSTSGTETATDTRTITYSPLTGSVVGFKSMAGRFPTRFYSAGTLLNGNQMLYDSATQNQWSQLMAVSLDGSLKGERLERFPLFWCRWGGVKVRYPDAQVLSRSTGIKRDYGRDPYGSYFSEDSYYSNAQLPFAVYPKSDRLPPKQRVLGIEYESRYGAIVRDAVRDNLVLNVNLGITPLVAMYDKQLQRITVFSRKLENGTVLEFGIIDDKLVDVVAQSEWNTDGQCFFGKYRGAVLEPVLAIDCMWFAWYAFHPGTLVLERSVNEPPRLRGPNIP